MNICDKLKHINGINKKELSDIVDVFGDSIYSDIDNDNTLRILFYYDYSYGILQLVNLNQYATDTESGIENLTDHIHDNILWFNSTINLKDFCMEYLIGGTWGAIKRNKCQIDFIDEVMEIIF